MRHPIIVSSFGITRDKDRWFTIGGDIFGPTLGQTVIKINGRSYAHLGKI